MATAKPHIVIQGQVALKGPDLRRRQPNTSNEITAWAGQRQEGTFGIEGSMAG